ncbi:MAG TPA: Protein YeeZ [Hyphomicrobiaceae bacterium MAG_BT-2024]
MTKVFFFGLGYSASFFARICIAHGFKVFGTARSESKVSTLRTAGIEAFGFNSNRPTICLDNTIAQATHIVISIAPDKNGDPVLKHYAKQISESKKISWIAYLSTIGVYGNHYGAWIDENTVVAPASERSVHRLNAENAWINLARSAGKSLQIFRLSGIYGPGRSAIDKINTGKARRLIKPGQVFNRIHVHDIATTLLAGIKKPQCTGIFNVADDLPAPPQDVIAFAAQLLGKPIPDSIPFSDADLSPMARSFYNENKRVRNCKIKQMLEVKLNYPTYEDGLTDIVTNNRISSL